jgi:hypothetical protein
MTFSVSTAAGYAGFLSTLITLGMRLLDALRALRKKRLAAAASRLAVSRNSIVWPLESTARYRYLSWPLTFIYVYICLVGTVTLFDGLQMGPTPLVQFGRIDLHPAPDAAGIHCEAPLGQDLGHVFVRQWIA